MKKKTKTKTKTKRKRKRKERNVPFSPVSNLLDSHNEIMSPRSKGLQGRTNKNKNKNKTKRKGKEKKRKEPTLQPSF
jgi:hypothetical protein